MFCVTWGPYFLSFFEAEELIDSHPTITDHLKPNSDHLSALSLLSET